MALLRIARSPSPNRLWYASLFVAAVVLSLHLAWIISSRSDPAVLMPSSNGLSFLESALATVALGLVALKTARQGERRHLGWAFLTLAMLANTLGEATWWLIQQTQGEVPVSSVADIVYLAFYPLFAIGLVLLPVAPQRFVERRRIALDMGSAFLAGTLVFWVFGIGPALAGSPIDKVELATALAYPAGDVALFWALLVLISRPVPAASQPALRLLAGGVAVMLVTDSLYSYQAITGVYASGDFLDLGYTVMCILYGLAAMREITLLPRDLDGGRAGAQDDGPPGPLVNWSLGLPYAAMLFAFALLVWDHFRPTGVDFPVLVAFLGGIIALLSIRQLLALSENDALRKSERELTSSLLRARVELERRVDVRTRELQAANAALEGEIVQHQAAEALLRASILEKEVLLKEVHHRVKNNLQIVSSLFSLQSQNARDAALADALIDGQARIRAMSLIHEKLYASPDLARLDFADYLRALVPHIYRTYRPHAAPIRLEMDVPAVWLNVDTAVPCGLIVNELVANALKHGFPDGRSGAVRVEVERVDEGTLRLSVSDDGVGLAPDFDLNRTGSLGLQLATMLTRQIDGEMELKRGQGTRFDIAFPAPSA